MRLKVATWNINSVRLRSGLVSQFLAEHRARRAVPAGDQVPGRPVPVRRFRKPGYEHIAIHGAEGLSRRRRRSPAFLSRVATPAVFCGKDDARHIAITLTRRQGDAAGVTIHNFYVPAGGDIPDPEAQREIRPQARLPRRNARLVRNRQAGRRPRDPGRRPQRRSARNRRLEPQAAARRGLPYAHRMRKVRPVQEAAAGWTPSARSGPNPSRSSPGGATAPQEWEKSDRGRRLDHSGFRKASRRASRPKIMRHARSWERPSDHVPVIVNLEV